MPNSILMKRPHLAPDSNFKKSIYSAIKLGINPPKKTKKYDSIPDLAIFCIFILKFRQNKKIKNYISIFFYSINNSFLRSSYAKRDLKNRKQAN